MEIVAEIGTAHQGSLEKAEKLIRQAALCGADWAKFQVVFAREILHPKAGLVPLPGGLTPLYEVFQSLEQDVYFYEALRKICEAEGIGFLASPFGPESAALLKTLEPRAVKIASPELNYTDLLRELASWGIPLILSSGVSRREDVAEAVSLLRQEWRGTEPFSLTLLHCVTSYPAPEEDYNLAVLPSLAESFSVPVGVSDHSLDPSLVPCCACLEGAVMVEKHFTLSRREGGLDDPIALEPEAFRLMVDRLGELEALQDRDRAAEKAGREALVRQWFEPERIEAVRGTGIKKLSPSEEKSYGRTNRSVHAMTALAPGAILTEENCRVLRTEKVLGPGMHPRYYRQILGAAVNKAIPAGEGIRKKDVNIQL